MLLSRQIAVYKRLREQPLWSLLASDNAPIALAVLQKHLLEKERRVPQSILHERIGHDLEDLRADGFEVPKAQHLIYSWLTSGYIERYFPAGAIEEEYEISAAGAQAIRFITSLIEQKTSATESRLATVIYQLTSLIEATDKNPASRMSALLNEKERLDQQIRDVEQKRFKVLDDTQALERVREIINLSEELIADFRRVRDRFEVLNRDLCIPPQSGHPFQTKMASHSGPKWPEFEPRQLPRPRMLSICG